MQQDFSMHKLDNNPVAHCSGCPLQGETIVPYLHSRASGGIMIVGESPGHTEIEIGQPFVGRAGKLLRDNIQAAGIPLGHVFIANSARCMIDKNRLTARDIKDVLRHCRPALVSAIHEYKPFLVLALGDIAMYQILGIKGITQQRGKVFYSEEFDCGCMPLFHPAYVLRGKPSREPVFLRDLKWAKMHVYVKPLTMHQVIQERNLS